MSPVCRRGVDVDPWIIDSNIPSHKPDCDKLFQLRNTGTCYSSISIVYDRERVSESKSHRYSQVIAVLIAATCAEITCI